MSFLAAGVGDNIMTPAVDTSSAPPPDKKTIKSIIPRIFGAKRSYSRESFSEEEVLQSDGNTHENERRSSGGGETLILPVFNQSMGPETVVQNIRVFVGTWNVGGNTPTHGMNLEDFLQVEGSADLYVLGFQEIVPLNAGNVLVIEDNEPASKWLALISHALNKRSYHYHDSKQPHNIFQKHCLKALSKNLRGDTTDHHLFKACNCTTDDSSIAKLRDTSSDHCNHSDDCVPRQKYQLVASKQMVGLFLSVWARRDLAQDIGHLRISCMGTGIMGYLGNKGCISISMTVHQTSFCFVCSHLASGEKEGDELRRNSDVAEILKGIYFPRICKNHNARVPEKIVDHDRVIWLGDLNYRLGLSYEEARLLLDDNDWKSLLEKDQLNTEREARRVFSGWKEGKISFAPTYKYSQNSDSYAGETTKSKRKRRTPAWCDRILWRGDGVEQLSYIRGESRFSDHRPVSAVFAIEVELRSTNSKLRKGFSCAATQFQLESQDFCCTDSTLQSM